MNFETTDNVILHIVGENRLQNELMASFLEKEARLISCCNIHRDMPSDINSSSAEKHLILLDCISAEFPETFARLAPNHFRCFSALFNAVPDETFEKQALTRGIRGVFYRTESPQTFADGIYAILNNELRYSPKVLSSFISEKHIGNLPENNVRLTRTEREVLSLIADDMKNPDISEKLFISIHTVKTHVCRIYKKIGLQNRSEAIVWAKRHL